MDNLKKIGALETPKTETNKHKRLIRRPSYYANRPERQYLFDGLITHPSITMLYAPSGGQKSQFSLNVASCLVHGKPFLGHVPSQPRTVLYIDGEQGPDDVADRLRIFGLDSKRAEERLLYLRKEVPIDYAQESDRNDLLELLDELRSEDKAPDLIIFDNIRTLQTLENENASESFKPNNDFVQLLRDKGFSVWTVHHTNKGGRDFAGSGNATTVYESVIGLSSVEGIGNGYALRINVEKDRSSKLESIKGKVVQREWEFIFDCDEYVFLEDQSVSEEDAATYLYDALNDGKVCSLVDCRNAVRETGYKFSNSKLDSLKKVTTFICSNVLGQSKFDRAELDRLIQDAKSRKTA